MIGVRGQTFGLDDFDTDLRKETLEDAIAPVARGANLVADRMKRAVNRLGPSPPGTPVGKDEGHLQRAISSSPAEVHGNSVTAFVGVGAGPKGRAEVAKSRAEGVNVYEYAHTHEYGGVVRGRRYPARSYLRSVVAESEAAVDALLEDAL